MPGDPRNGLIKPTKGECLAPKPELREEKDENNHPDTLRLPIANQNQAPTQNRQGSFRSLADLLARDFFSRINI